MTPILSIVSGTYNRLTHLQNLIESVRRNIPRGLPYEIILVDGGSTDGTIEWAKNQADIRLIEHGELRGAIQAFSEGGFAARGKYVILANDDVTFHDGGIIKAIVHLENNPRCGAVAFADDRPYVEGQLKPHRVSQIGAMVDGKFQGVNYAQVGMFRKWLGDTCDWWGANSAMQGARTYGGDSYLSARIWELGYTVDAVDGCAVDDHIVMDGLRDINRPIGESDSAKYHAAFPNNPTVASEPTIPNPDKRLLRVLYLPILERGHAIQKQQKRGLRDALAKHYLVYELDYMSARDIRAELFNALNTFQPDVMLSQFHGPDIVTPEMMADIRAHCPRLVCVNWNGDVWLHSLTAPGMYDLLRHIDLQLVVNKAVLNPYAENRVAAAYWQIAYEPVDERDLPTVSKHDVVFLGNGYNDKRYAFGQFLRTVEQDLKVNVGIYGNDWREVGSQGECMYNFRLQRAILKNAKTAVAENQFLTDTGFFSDRVFNTLAAGGALLLHQRVNGLEELTGITAGTHFIQWETFEELRDLIAYWLDKKRDKQRKAIVKAARQFVETHHSFDVRVDQLFRNEAALIHKARRELRETITLRYVGRGKEPFGENGQRRHYYITPGVPFSIDVDDYPRFQRLGTYERIGGTNGDTLAQAVEG